MDELKFACEHGISWTVVRALMRLGVFVSDPHPSSDGPLRYKLSFTFTGDRELAKYHLQTFLEDEFNATHVEFYASQMSPRHCYAYFTPRRENPINAQEVKANNRRNDRERKASDHPTGR